MLQKSNLATTVSIAASPEISCRIGQGRSQKEQVASTLIMCSLARSLASAKTRMQSYHPLIQSDSTLPVSVSPRSLTGFCPYLKSNTLLSIETPSLELTSFDGRDIDLMESIIIRIRLLAVITRPPSMLSTLRAKSIWPPDIVW